MEIKSLKREVVHTLFTLLKTKPYISTGIEVRTNKSINMRVVLFPLKKPCTKEQKYGTL